MKFERFLFSRELIGKICFLLVVLLCFGYTLSASTASHLGILDAEVFNIVFRAIYPALSIFLVVGGLMYAWEYKMTKLAFVFFLFSFFYWIKFFYEVEFKGLMPGRLSKIYLYAFSIGNTLLPITAIFLTARLTDYKKYLNKLYWFVAFLNVSLITFVLINYGFDFQVFIVRNSLDLDPTDNTRAVLGPITYSFTGEVMALLALTKILILKDYNSRWILLVCILTGFIGFINLILGASRGPFVGFVLTSLMVFYYYLRNSRKVASFYIRLANWTFSIIAGIIIAFSTVLKDIEFSIINRLFTTIEKQQSGEGEHRNTQWDYAWGNFLESPVFGDAYLIKEIRVDPHNVFLEVFMATGVVGATLFYIAFFGLLIKIVLSIVNKDKYFFFLSIVMQACVFTMAFSSNIFRGYRWMGLLVFLLAIPLSRKTDTEVEI